MSPDEGRGMDDDVRNKVHVGKDGVDKQLAVDMAGYFIMVPQMHTAIGIESKSYRIGYVDQYFHECPHLQLSWLSHFQAKLKLESN